MIYIMALFIFTITFYINKQVSTCIQEKNLKTIYNLELMQTPNF